MVFMPVSDLKRLIQEIVDGELQKVTYYSQRNAPDENMTLEEAATYCKVCSRTLVSRVIQGKLTNGGTGRKYLFRKSDLDAFMFKTKKK